MYAYRDGCDCATQKVQDFLEAEGGFKSGEIDPYLYTYQSLEAAAHLLRVTSGLDSMVRGECEILGQVKDAYQDALQAESCGPILSGLFRRAIHSGKRVRSETEVGCLAPSLAHFVVDIAHGTFQTLEQRKALLVGQDEPHHGSRLDRVGSDLCVGCQSNIRQSQVDGRVSGGRSSPF